MTKNRELSRANFEKLLIWLDSDRELAARKYESIRLRLIKIFTLRGCHVADELADKTIDRVAEKMDSVAKNYEGDPALYFYGAGKLVFLEFLKTPKPETLPHFIIQENNEKENFSQSYECLEKCLQELSEEQRKLIIEYYQDKKQAKIDHRKILAEKLGTSGEKLRVRVHRLRNILQKCVQRCMRINNV